jgi:hypothetical protein
MRNLYSCILICANLVVCGSAVAQNAPQGSAKAPSGTPGNSIAISALHDSVKAGSPIYIVVQLTNTTNHDIGFQRLRSGADCKMDVRDVQGNLPADTGRGYLHNGHVANSQLDETRFSGGDLSDNIMGEMVKAGQTIAWDINISKFYDLGKPGKYAIRLERADPEDPKTVLKSNTVTVTLTP